MFLSVRTLCFGTFASLTLFNLQIQPAASMTFSGAGGEEANARHKSQSIQTTAGPDGDACISLAKLGTLPTHAHFSSQSDG